MFTLSITSDIQKHTHYNSTIKSTDNRHLQTSGMGGLNVQYPIILNTSLYINLCDMAMVSSSLRNWLKFVSVTLERIPVFADREKLINESRESHF